MDSRAIGSETTPGGAAPYASPHVPADVIAIDGKTVRRSFQKIGAKDTIHMGVIHQHRHFGDPQRVGRRSGDKYRIE